MTQHFPNGTTFSSQQRSGRGALRQVMRFPPLWAAPPPGARAGGWALHGSTSGRAHHVKLLLQARARRASRVPPRRARTRDVNPEDTGGQNAEAARGGRRCWW
jgi:hypothetical protein